MKLYTIGDPHLSLGCDKPMDVFHGWENYLERLERNWNAAVRPEDTVVLAGDISWGMSLEEACADFAFLDRELAGTKILLRGNHDYWFCTKTRVESFWAEKGFSSLKLLFNNAYAFGDYAVCGTRGWVNEQDVPSDQKVISREAGRLRISLEAGKALGKKPVAFLHYPPVYYIHECREILDVLLEYGVSRCYYGHIHGSGHRYAIDGVYAGIDFRLVSCDYTHFHPLEVMEADLS